MPNASRRIALASHATQKGNGAYLECGIHAYGFARPVSSSCGHELLLAFSCKRRGVCPSCSARRMSDTAARLIDTVLPPVRLRQWVLSVPFDLRIILAKSPAALSACGRLFVEEIFRWQRLIGAWRGLVRLTEAHRALRGGAVSFPQRFGGSLNLNVHYHVVVPDAVFYRDAGGHMKSELQTRPFSACFGFDHAPRTHRPILEHTAHSEKYVYTCADEKRFDFLCSDP